MPKRQLVCHTHLVLGRRYDWPTSANMPNALVLADLGAFLVRHWNCNIGIADAGTMHGKGYREATDRDSRDWPTMTSRGRTFEVMLDDFPRVLSAIMDSSFTIVGDALEHAQIHDAFETYCAAMIETERALRKLATMCTLAEEEAE